MTDTTIQQTLFDAFMRLCNDKGKSLINDNVALPNISFNIPKDKRYYKLSFMCNPPTPTALCFDAPSRYTGVFQVDIYTPQDAGEKESNTKYNAICKLFRRGVSFDCVNIIKCYRKNNMIEGGCYRTIVSIEWDADLDIEE